MEEQPEKETMRLHPEKQAYPTAIQTVLSRSPPQRDGKAFWDAIQPDHHLARCWDACEALEPLSPREASVGTLCAGKDHVRAAKRSGDGRRYADINPLVSHKLSTGASVLSAAPIPRSRSGAGPTWRGWSNTLTCLGFLVAFPSH